MKNRKKFNQSTIKMLREVLKYNSFWIKKIFLLQVFIFLSKTSLYADEKINANVIIKSQKVAEMSPILYGIFFEDINLAADGGLYAEMVRNRSFEDIRPPKGCKIDHEWAVTPGGFRWYIGVNDSIPSWNLKLTNKARASMHLDTLFPLNKAQYYSLRVNIHPKNKGKVAIMNEGYYGIAVKKNAIYNISLYARSVSPLKKDIIITLEDEKRKIYGKTKISGITTEWKKCETKILATETHNKLKLVLTFLEPNTIWLDMVSMFPENTWKRRKNGWRSDLMEMLVGLNPKFLRFPGGCVVEDITFENMVNFKETIGDISERPGRVNVWGYRSTDGIGFHEFLQMAEDLNCEPLYVVNAGMTCQARNSYSKPLNELQPLIDDVLSAIEYANGPVTSYWGALRAKNGHPEPFGLKYLEIGNENWGEDYDIRYEIFYDAIKAKYPELIIIRSAHPTADKNPLYFPNNKGDILDLHYYRSPDWIFKNFNIFDDYPRIGKKLYIGEFACNEQVGRGNLYAALADAVFMVAIERNADIITMASYAPLFENVDKEGYKWPVNLIHFNNHKVYAMPTYYAQQMFTHNVGHILLYSQIISDSIKIPTHYSLQNGAIGFDTYSTEAIFDDVCLISGNDTIFYETFDSPQTSYPLIIESGSWNIKNGVLHQTDASLFAHAFMGDTAWSNYSMTFKAKRISGNEGFFMTINRKNADNWIRWNIGGWNNTQHALEMRWNGTNSFIAPMVPGKVRNNEWYKVTMKVEGRRIQCLLNDTLIHDVVLPEYQIYQRIYGVVTEDTINNTLIIKLVNPFNYASKIYIDIDKQWKVHNDAEVITLSSPNPQDTHSFANPNIITPIKSIFTKAQNQFYYSLQPNSLTLLKIKKY